MKPVMALRRKQDNKAFISELNPIASSLVSEKPEKLSGEGDDPNPEKPGRSEHDIQPSSPMRARSSLSDGSEDESGPPQPDSMDEDSLSEYENIASGEEGGEEHDYEEDLQTEADRMTYYVHCCPEDESYMEGMDCHEGPDGAEGPGTSRDLGVNSKPEAWGHSEGFYEVVQKDATTLVYKRPEPITETTFVQAPMAEDEEDDEETEEELEESEEEDDGYFFYKDAEENNNEIQHIGDDGFAIRAQDFNLGQGRNQDNPKHPKDVYPGSSYTHRGRNGEDSPKDRDVPGVKGGRNDPGQSSRYQGQKTEREHKRDQDAGGVTAKAKHTDPEDRVVWKKRHSLKNSREDNRDREEIYSQQQRKSPGDRKNRPTCSHIPKGAKGKQSGDVDEEQLEKQVKAQSKVVTQNSGRDKGGCQHTNDERGTPDGSRTSESSSCRRNSQPRACDTTSVQSRDKQMQKDFAKPTEEKSRVSQEQVCQSSPNDRKTETPAGQNKEPPQKNPSFPSFVDIPGPCEPEDLVNGIIFAANYLGSTQLLSDRNPSKSIRMKQAQEALDCVKSVEGDAHSLTEIDLFISTKAIKVLNADTQETMMDNALRTISYIADIGNVVVLMARRRLSNSSSLDCTDSGPAGENRKQYRMICYVFESEDAQLIAQSIGQAFSMAYQEFLRANGINPKDLSQKDYSDILNSQEMYNDDLIHFSNSENCKEIQLEKQKGEILGVVIVESGWGSILPTVILACMLNNGPATRSGKLNVGDQIMAVNDTSLVGLPLSTCQGIIKGLKNHTQVKLSVVSCPPVTTVIIKRPDLQYQLGFSVQNGIICSLMRGGIAERGGVRVGHRIIEINGQSVVAMAHEKIVHALSVSVGEIKMKTMPAVMFRLLTGQETPVYI
ncbi:Amyloid-beta A4 precursor protein-binding family A member 2 [Triplophysa tibetana]|uniref:Amyloid-beta A4 precursor protein-binding family A member 3 n=1 Tax=Triplophysa tibetana TaxID=1572043 RepID=A0A5A9PPM2_9TELE|nr:Amyloid-beta A4 precursor protein-binding family A member 2 [Triplophysa tibetana]